MLTIRPSRRQSSQVRLINIIHPSVFVPRGTGDVPVESTTMYRIPLHQRFPSWKQSKKQRLVESVLKDYPVHAIILTENYANGGKYYDIEDGQTRLTALQEFLEDGFACEPGTIGGGCKFSELSQELRDAFTSYQLTVETFVSSSSSPEDMADIFERLNSGKPLGDNDKYYSRVSTSPVLQFLDVLKSHVDLRVDFGLLVGPIGTGKTRKLLGDIVGAILAVATRGSDVGGDACITTSYEQNYRYLMTVLTDEQKEDIITFFKAYFVKVHEAIDTCTTKPQKRYGKLSGALGLAVSTWVNDGTVPASIAWYVRMMFYNRDWEPASFSQLSVGDRRNCQGDAVKRRMAKLQEQWVLSGGVVQIELVINEDASLDADIDAGLDIDLDSSDESDA